MTNPRLRHLPAIVCGALACIAVLLSAGCQSQREKDLPSLSFRLKWTIYSSFASHFVALDNGLFQASGVNVKIEAGGPGIDPIRLVATGENDVGLATYDQILIAREKGIPVVAIGEDYVRSGVGFFSLKTSGIVKPGDFVNKKVGILPGTDKHSVYLALLESQGIDRNTIQEIPVGADIAVLLNGAVDVYPGFVTNQPFVAEERGIPVNVIDPFEYGVRPGGNVYFTSEKLLSEKRDLLKKFLTAVLRGILLSQQLSDSEVVHIVMQHNAALDRNAELKIWRATKAVLLEKDASKIGLMDPAKWQYTAEITRKSGQLTLPTDLQKCYTNDLVREILSEGVPGNSRSNGQ